MMDAVEKRAVLINHLQSALTLSDELYDTVTGFFVARALDEARTQLFGSLPHSRSPQVQPR